MKQSLSSRVRARIANGLLQRGRIFGRACTRLLNKIGEKMIERAQTQQEIDEQECDETSDAKLRLNPLPTFEHPMRAAPAGGPVSDIEMCRAVAKMIRQFLVGYTFAEVEAMAAENVVEGAEGNNVDVHLAAAAKLKDLADKFDPPVPMDLRFVAPKTPLLSHLMPALRGSIR